MIIDLEKIPPELKARPQWVVWREETREGEKTKVPYNPADPERMAKANDPSTWGGFEKALSVAQANGFSGVGFEFASPHCGLDLDKCRDPETGQVKYCAGILIDFLDSYTELSPSKTGFHAIIKGRLPEGAKHTKLSKCGWKLEVYDARRYFTMTGDHLEGAPLTIEDQQAELTALHKEVFGEEKKEAPRPPGPSPTTNLADSELIDLAHRAINREKFGRLWRGDITDYGDDDSRADLALCGLLAFWTGGDAARMDRLFRQSGLYRNPGREKKWDRKTAGSTYGMNTIKKAISKATEFYTPGGQRPPEPTPERQKQGTAATAVTGKPTPIITASPFWPQEVMTGAAGMFARTYADYLETPMQFLFMSYLTSLGHVIVDKIILQSEVDPQPRLFVVHLGESSDSRKSTSISKTESFFHETITEDDFNVLWGVGSAEGLAKCFEKNNKVLLILDELQSLIQKMRIDASVLLPCINTLFEGNRFYNITKKHDIQLDDAKLCLLAASTLDTYRNLFTSSFTNIGFINRLFIVIGDSQRKFSIPNRIPENERESLKADLREVLAFVGELSRNGCYSIPITSQAREIFDAWYFGLEESVFIKRLDTYGHRLMPLLAVNEMKASITPEIAERTVALLNYQLAARKFADPIDADSTIARTEERIRRLLASRPLAKRDLERAGNKSKVGIGLWDQAIKNLRNAGEIFFENGIYSHSP